MSKIDKNVKQIYDSAFTVISNLHLKKNAISREEMYFLLTLLDQVMKNKSAPDFLNLLKEWQSGPGDEEIDPIIKATLLQVDFNDPLSAEQNLEIIDDLLSYRRNEKLN